MESVIAHLQDSTALAKLVGQAPAFLRAIEPLPAIAKSSATVLISGETGTGKELAARAIHYLSPRAAFPFVAINCGALPDTLLEDELFGHERGAFTDARSRRIGMIAQAEKGTLFLDEVDALTRAAQVTLLRVLQDKGYRPVGAGSEQQADVRVVAATNAPVPGLVQSGAFRADLYFRLCVFTMHLPPLRERREDIAPLASYFLQKHAPPEGSPRRLSEPARASLLAHDWPGNVRELENVIIRGCHLCRGEVIEICDLGLAPRAPITPSLSTLLGATLQPLRMMKQQVIEVFEKDYLTRLMSDHHGNVTKAARTAGKERRELGKLLKKYHINAREFQIAGSPACS
jgi:DNA-binding NtrC family response regulator